MYRDSIGQGWSGATTEGETPDLFYVAVSERPILENLESKRGTFISEALKEIEDARERLRAAHERLFLEGRGPENLNAVLVQVQAATGILDRWLYMQSTPGEYFFADVRSIRREEILTGFQWYVTALKKPSNPLPRSSPEWPFNLARLLIDPKKPTEEKFGTCRGQ